MNLLEINDKYMKNGFVVIRNFFDKDSLLKIEKSIKSHISFHLHKHGVAHIKDLENEGLIKLNDIRKDKSKFDSMQVVYNTIRKLPETYNLISNPKLIEVVKKLSGITELDINGSPYIWEGFCRVDPPQDETYDLRWHQESYFTLPNSNSVQLWAPIINNITENETGTIMTIANSHKSGEIPHHIVRQNNNYISESILPENLGNFEEGGKFELNVGDVLLFHENLIHRTINNQGSKVRYTLIANYSNPYLSNFKFMSEDQVVAYHKMRTANAAEFADYIKTYTNKGGIKDFNLSS